MSFRSHTYQPVLTIDPYQSEWRDRCNQRAPEIFRKYKSPIPLYIMLGIMDSVNKPHPLRVATMKRVLANEEAKRIESQRFISDLARSVNFALVERKPGKRYELSARETVLFGLQRLLSMDGLTDEYRLKLDSTPVTADEEIEPQMGTVINQAGLDILPWLIDGNRKPLKEVPEELKAQWGPVVHNQRLNLVWSGLQTLIDRSR